MKNYPITALIALGLISLTNTSALAAGGINYRNVASNNIFQCSTNQQIEVYRFWGNGSSVGQQHTLICLESDLKAKWIIDSVLTCESSFAKSQGCPMDDVYSEKKLDSENTLVFKPQKTGIGTNCNIVKKTGEYNTVFYHWSCEKYSSRQNLTIITKGQPLEWPGSLYNKYGKIPSEFQFTNPDNPNCVEDEGCQEDYPGLGGDPGKLDPKSYIDCRGDAQYCNWAYNLDL